MAYVRYPFIFRNQTSEVSEEMDLSESKLYPDDVVPFVAENLERIEHLFSAFRLAVLPGTDFEDTFSVYMPSLSGSKALFASDYCLIHAYLRTYLHNLGQSDRQMTLIVDRRFDMWQEVALMTIGIGRLLGGFETINKILLIEPTGFFSSVDLKPSSNWYTKLFRFSPQEFDSAISQDNRIASFRGNLPFDLQIYLNGQYVILKALRFATGIYPRLKEKKSHAENLIRNMKNYPDQSYSAKQIFDEHTIVFKALKSEILETTTGMIREMQGRADTYGEKYQYVVNDCIVVNRIMGELTNRMNECEKSIDQLTLSSLNHTQLQMFIQWHQLQISVYKSLETKFSLSDATIDRYSVLEQVDECEVLIGYLDLVNRKLGEFKETLDYYPDYKVQAKEVVMTTEKIRPLYENLQKKIVKFANENENSDPLLVEKFTQYFSARNRKTKVEYENTKFFKESLKNCQATDDEKEIQKAPNSQPENENENLIANFDEPKDSNFDLSEFKHITAEINESSRGETKEINKDLTDKVKKESIAPFDCYDDRLEGLNDRKPNTLDIKPGENLFEFDKNCNIPMLNQECLDNQPQIIGEKLEKMSIMSDDLIIRFD